MARKPEKSTVRNIINNLINSEIPEIQTVAKELAEWTRQLEEHSWKLEHYASEIESIAAAEAEGSEEVSLTDLVKDLEKTLAMLREKPADQAAVKSGDLDLAAEPEDILEETAVEDEVPEALGTSNEGKKSEQRDLAKEDTYITPEGFVLRRRR